MSDGFLLSHVVNQGDIAACQALLTESMVDPNAPNAAGESALHVAIRRCLPSLVELLLRFDANPGQPSDARCGAQTPLHLAAELDQNAALAMLLQFGADPNVVNAQRETPLHVAARLGHASSARMLIAHGASVLAEDGLGRSPLRLAEASARRSAAHAEIAAAIMVAIRDSQGAGAADALKVDHAAVAAAGGPVAAVAAGNATRLSGIPLLPSGQFMAEARQMDAAHIAWLNTVVKKEGKRK